MISQNKFIESLNCELKLLGGRLYYVGGAVRDEFLKRVTNDFDLVVTGVGKEAFEEIYEAEYEKQYEEEYERQWEKQKG